MFATRDENDGKFCEFLPDAEKCANEFDDCTSETMNSL
jgi:hypothetical protein